VARVAELLGDGGDGARPRLVVVGGEVLTPLMRQQIRAAFGAPVREWYGSHEFNLLAWECDETGLLHVCDDAVVVEIVRDGRPVTVGQRGEVVVTGLHSFAMPFIRYRLGDVATRGPDRCPCGAPFSTLASIQGRMHDWLVLANGRAVHPYEVLLELYDAFPWCGQYQVVQERVGHVRILLSPRRPPPPAATGRLAARISARLGGLAAVSIDLVPDMRPASTGSSGWSGRWCAPPTTTSIGARGEAERPARRGRRDQSPGGRRLAGLRYHRAHAGAEPSDAHRAPDGDLGRGGVARDGLRQRAIADRVGAARRVTPDGRGPPAEDPGRRRCALPRHGAADPA
jgi:hypothetical protein